VLSVVAGIVAVVWPHVTALILVVLIGAWAVVTGALAIVAATQEPNGWLPIAVGVASVLAGVLILVNPRAGAFALALVIGVYAIAAGVLMLAESWRLSRLASGSSRNQTARAASV
jgi:uncharacterized membrane protein HdeD (DUF308 family)